jgi:hypothetical protein
VLSSKDNLLHLKKFVNSKPVRFLRDMALGLPRKYMTDDRLLASHLMYSVQGQRRWDWVL